MVGDTCRLHSFLLNLSSQCAVTGRHVKIDIIVSKLLSEEHIYTVTNNPNQKNYINKIKAQFTKILHNRNSTRMNTDTKIHPLGAVQNKRYKGFTRFQEVGLKV